MTYQNQVSNNMTSQTQPIQLINNNPSVINTNQSNQLNNSGGINMISNTQPIIQNPNNIQVEYPNLENIQNNQPNIQTNTNLNQQQQIPQQPQNPKYFGIWGPELKKNR